MALIFQDGPLCRQLSSESSKEEIDRFTDDDGRMPILSPYLRFWPQAHTLMMSYYEAASSGESGFSFTLALHTPGRSAFQ